MTQGVVSRVFIQSGRRDSNSDYNLPKVACYRYTTSRPYTQRAIASPVAAAAEAEYAVGGSMVACTIRTFDASNDGTLCVGARTVAL